MTQALPPRYVPKNNFHFDFPTENFTSSITFSSCFDSGNLGNVDRVSQHSYIIHAAPDFPEANYQTICRSWFYFSIQGVPKGSRLTLRIKRVNILYTIFRLAPRTYKPVFKIGDGPWERVEDEVQLIEDPEERTLDVLFRFTFGNKDTTSLATEADFPEEAPPTFFAFSYPYSYKESQMQITMLNNQYSRDPDIYFHREILIRSPQRRKIDLITISSHEGKLTECEPYMNVGLFPYKDTIPRASKFASNKPVVLLTSRVHPGETPSSHSMNGIIKFLLNKEDPRAKLLRQHFVFLLIPMLNPDGVAQGFYRLDTHGQNLNRHYRMPEFDKQPATYAVRRLVQQLHYDNRIFFYCDLHSHAGKKGCFLYGNAMNFSMQVETLVFSRLMSINTPGFQYEYCNFSKKHMYARDRGEKLTKEGAGRVSVFRMCNLLHSYTLECGFHYYVKHIDANAPLPKASYPPSDSTMVIDTLPAEEKQVEPPVYYTIESFEEVGEALLISILDIFEKNPQSKVGDSRFGNLQNMRSEIATHLSRQKDFELLTNPRMKCPSLCGVASKSFYNDFLLVDGPKKTTYPFARDLSPKKNDHNESKDRHRMTVLDISRDLSPSPQREFPEILRESIHKKIGESPQPEKRASSMGVAPTSMKNSRVYEPNLRTKIGDLLASMAYERNKTQVAYGDAEEREKEKEKVQKIRKVKTPKKAVIRRVDLELNTLISPSEADLVGFEDDKRKENASVLPQLWDTSPIQKEKLSGIFFEPFSFEETKKSFHVNLIQKIKDSKNRRRLLTYRGLYGKEQMTQTSESPTFKIEAIKKEAVLNDGLPIISRSHTKPKNYNNKRQILKPLAKGSLSKKYERIENLMERIESGEFFDGKEMSLKIEKYF